jgi:hypothetical protein
MTAATDDPTAAAATLRAAWTELLAALGRARAAIDDPKLHAPPSTDRVLAEGYRYLLGWVHGAVERAFHADPVRPQFRRAIQPISRSTIDNADALYLNAEIDGARRYLIRGRAEDHRHWRGEAPAPSGRKAPHYVIFEAATDYAGDSGSIAELRPGRRVGTGKLDSSELIVEPDGRFEILLAPERPAGHAGNFLATRRVRTPSSRSYRWTTTWRRHCRRRSMRRAPPPRSVAWPRSSRARCAFGTSSTRSSSRPTPT